MTVARIVSDSSHRVELALHSALASAEDSECPPRLRQAMHHAVFPGGGRLRPRILLDVAAACGDDDPALSSAAAAAVELLHCASLVHDDLPCFDDARERRGAPTVHRLFGEELAVLCGDALIVLAFEALTCAPTNDLARLRRVLAVMARSVGPCGGIIAGQAWESEPRVDLSLYHRAKTGALFEAAISAGVAAAGSELAPWRGIGLKLGEAYQVADDIADVLADPRRLGKPVGKDARMDRPSAVRRLGVEGAMSRINGLLEQAVAMIPPCPGRTELRQRVLAMVTKQLGGLRGSVAPSSSLAGPAASGERAT